MNNEEINRIQRETARKILELWRDGKPHGEVQVLQLATIIDLLAEIAKRLPESKSRFK